MRCPISNLTSVEIDAFEFENLNMKKKKKKKKKRELMDSSDEQDVVLYRIHNKPLGHVTNLSTVTSSMTSSSQRVRRSIDDYRGHIYQGKTMKEKIMDSLISSKDDEVGVRPSQFYTSRHSTYRVQHNPHR